MQMRTHGRFVIICLTLTLAFGQFLFIPNSASATTVPAELDADPRISYWWGKVNQHTEDGVWKTDPDGVSHASLNKLTYCQKWYPNTVSIEDYGETSEPDWKEAGNTGSYTSTKPVYKCVQEEVQQLPKLIASADNSTSSLLALPGKIDQLFTNITLDATGSSEDIRVSRIDFVHQTSKSAIHSYLYNLKLYIGDTQLATLNYPDPGMTTETLNDISFVLSSAITIHKNSAKTITLRGDISGAAELGTTHQFNLVDVGYILAFDKSSNNQIETEADYPLEGILVTINVQGLKPDLIIKDFSWQPVSPKVGETDLYLYVDFTVVNIGNVPVPLIGTVYSLYRNNLNDPIAHLYATNSQTILQPGDIFTYNNMTTMQSSGIKDTAGIFELIMKADSEDTIDESNENNNTLTKTITINPISNTCTDSDSGKSYYTKGQSTGANGITWTDRCNENNGDLVENYCNGTNVNFISYTCPNGCSNGVCIESSNNKPDLVIKNFKYTDLRQTNTGPWEIQLEFNIANIGAIKPNSDFNLKVTNLTNNVILKDQDYAAIYFEPNSQSATVHVVGYADEHFAPGVNNIQIQVDSTNLIAESNEANNTLTKIITVATTELDPTPVATPSNSQMATRLKGRLLLAVENRGRIHYVNPDDLKKYEVTFGNVMSLFQNLALGITNADLHQISIHPNAVSPDKDSDGDGFNDQEEVTHGYNPDKPSDPSNRGNDKLNINPILAKRLIGKLLLQVEDRGRIWYIDQDGQRWEVTFANVMNLFTSLALGITNQDLAQMADGN